MGGIKGDIYSGPGSHDLKYTEPYIKWIKTFLKNYCIKSICEIGCGDYNIMNQVLKDANDIKYYGIDVVSTVIDKNNSLYKDDLKVFTVVDAVDPNCEIPDADCLVIRQVLQHLSNKNIKIILERTRRYKYAIITEHLYDGNDVVYNIDKPSGMNIRFDNKSGVYIDRNPYNIKTAKVVLNIPYGKDAVLRTWLVSNQDLMSK